MVMLGQTGSHENTMFELSSGKKLGFIAGSTRSAMVSGVQPSEVCMPRTGRGWLIRKISLPRTAKICAVTSALFNNDAGVLLLTPIIVPVIRRLYPIRKDVLTAPFAFAVFMSVRYFEADDTTNGPQPATGPQNVLIGGPDNTIPGYRGFFVIDRSKPEEAYDPNTQRFTNYRNLVKYQLQLP